MKLALTVYAVILTIWATLASAHILALRSKLNLQEDNINALIQSTAYTKVELLGLKEKINQIPPASNNQPVDFSGLELRIDELEGKVKLALSGRFE